MIYWIIQNVRIYNVDESGVPLEHLSPLVIGQRKVHYCTSDNKSQVTCIKGYWLLYATVYHFWCEKPKYTVDWTKDEVPYGSAGSTWQCLKNAFSWHSGSARPLLLFLDGHSSHYNMYVITMARDNGVITFNLVPHTTHKMQPLNAAVFRKVNVLIAETLLSKVNADNWLLTLEDISIHLCTILKS